MPVPSSRSPSLRLLICACFLATGTLFPACAATHTDDIRAEEDETIQETIEIAHAVSGPTMAEARRLFAAKRFEEAVPALRAITERDPENSEAWFDLGYALHALGRLEEALVVHERAAEFYEVRPVALYNLGCAHALLGDPDAAFEALDAAVTAGFNDLGVMRQDEDLVSLHADARWTALLSRLEVESGHA